MNQPETTPPSAPPTYPDEFFLKTLLRWYIGLIIRPAPTIREIVERRPAYWLGLITLMGGTVVAALSTSMSLGFYDNREGPFSLADEPGAGWLVEIITILMFCGMLMSSITIWGAMLHWIGKICRGEAEFMVTVGIVMQIPIVALTLYAVGISITAVLFAWNQSDIPTEDLALYAFSGFSLVGLLWAATLVLYAIKLTHKISTPAAALTVAGSIVPSIALSWLALIPWILLWLGLTAMAGVSHFE